MIKVNINPGASYTAIAPASQYDVGRELIFTIYDGSSAASLPSGAQVTMVGTKPSGLGFTTQGTISGNQVTVVTNATMTEEAGHIPAELRFSYNGNNIGTANFIFAVEGSPHTNDTTDGDAETAKDMMTRAEEAVTEAESAAQTAAAQAAKAEAAAEAISQAGIDTTGATAGQVPTANGAGGWSWQDQQGGGGGSSDDIENVSSVSGSTVSDALNSLSDEIANLEGGAPTPVATAAGMTDATKIYLYTGSETGYNAGHWYYYSGGQWVDGGAYGEAASMSAGVKAALLACFQHVAWIDENGQTYYDNLYNELYPTANLVSITATYTQSGTVYDTASLDDLKTDLVVTANYSDGTSETVTTYMLSGALAVGTSTITVSYSGKTATFTVNVTQEPPYTFYDYLQGDGKAYINTGLTASVYNTLSYDHEIKAARYNSANTKAIYGARQQWGSANARQVWWNSPAYGVNFCASSTTAVADASSNAVPITVKTTRDKKIYRDGVEVTYTAGNIGSITHTGPITMFAECTGGQGSGYVAIADTNAFAGAFSACRIYYLKIWDENGELVAYIRPALRKSDNAIGMYDSVRDMFFENANSTGAFSLGNE